MADEERTAVEETKAAEEVEAVEKAEAEESKAVEETKVEEKTVEEAKTEPVKEALDAKEETKTSDGGGGSDDLEISEEELRKALETIPPELPPGAVFTFNVHHVESGEGYENYVSGCVGLFAGSVLKFRIVSGEVQYGNVMEYSAFIDDMVRPTGTAPKVLELSGCGRSLPSKESTRFAMSITLFGGSK